MTKYPNTFAKRTKWLITEGRRESDVMQDERAAEFVLREGENGMERVYLPEEIQMVEIEIDTHD